MSVARQPTIRGRANEQDALLALVTSAASGSGGSIALEGEAGIGKTRLADEVEAAARQHGFAVHRAAAQQLERDRPFGILTDAFGVDQRSEDPERAVIATLLYSDEGTLGSEIEGGLRYRIVEGFVDLVERLGANGPTVLILDDLHWADVGTLIALHRIVGLSVRLPVLTILSMRPTPRSSELTALCDELRAAGMKTLRLDPLDTEDVVALSAEQLGAKPGPTLVEALRSTGGNPLFAMELTTALEQDRLIDIESGVVEVKELATPRSIQITILQRFSFLAEDTLELLRLASVLGTSFLPQDLVALSGRDEVSVLRLLEEPIKAGLITGTAGALSFRHDLVRDVLYYDMPEPLRRSLHARAAEMLTAAGLPASRIAGHVVIAAVPGNDSAIKWLWDEGRRSARLEPGTGVDLLQRALELTPEMDSRGVEIRADLVYPLLWTGRGAEAEKVALEALARCDDLSLEIKLRLSLGDCLEHQARLESVEHLLIAAEKAKGRPDESRILALAAWAMRLRSPNLDLTEGFALTERALALAAQFGDDVARVVALMAESWYFQQLLEFEPSISSAELAVEVSRTTRDAEVARRTPYMRLAPVLIFAGRLVDARGIVDEGLRRAEAVGALVNLPNLYLASGEIYRLNGQWDDAITEFETALQTASDYHVDVEVAAGRLANIHTYRGETLAARSYLDRTRGGPDPDHAMQADAVIAEAQGDFETAATIARSFVDLMDKKLAVFLLPTPWIRFALEVGDQDLVGALAAKSAAAAANTQVPRARASALVCSGLAERDAALLLEGTDAYRSTECVIDLAFADLEAGIVLVEMGEKEAATTLLTEAIEIFETAGAESLIARAAALLRQVGIRRGVAGRRGRPIGGWESVTGTEQRVLDLIVQGLTNRGIGERLFVSKRTVDTHVTHLFQKIGAANRADLIAKALTRRANDERVGAEE